jgi:hypothetical protein
MNNQEINKIAADYANANASKGNFKEIEKAVVWGISMALSDEEKYSAKLRHINLMAITDYDKAQDRINALEEGVRKALLPENIECDGMMCQGCYKDILRELIKTKK